MEFKLVEGPWKTVFSGKIENHSVEILSNSEELILVMILDESNGKKSGAVLELFKTFNSVGETETFIETLPREVIGLIKHDESQTVKFLILGSGPTYAKYDEREISKELSELFKKIKSASVIVNDVSKAYNLTLKELSQCNEKTKQAFFGEPLLAPMLSKQAFAREHVHEMAESKYSEGEIVLGITKEGIQIKEPTYLFSKTIVYGGTVKERMRSINVIIEGLLLSNIPVAIFDSNKTFNSLREPSRNPRDLKKFKIEAGPIGFPVKDFNAAKDIKADLKFVEADSLLESFGVGKNPLNALLKKVFIEGGFRQITEIVERIKKEKEQGDITEFQKNKASRILRLIDFRYPEMFDSENNISEISRKWLRGLGRAGLINLSEIDDRQKIIITNNLLKGLVEFYKQSGPTKEIRTVVVLPEANKIIPLNESSGLALEILNSIIEGEQYGIGWLLGTENITDLKQEIRQKVAATISIVRENDIGVELADKKPYRATIRCSLSECTI